MNSCVLMARIVQDPELRYTSDNQTPVAQLLVEFSGLRSDDPPATLKVVGWGNLASEIQESYKIGDRVIIEGRLGMNTIERPEGFKEKRAELTVSRLHKLESDPNYVASRSESPEGEQTYRSIDSEYDNQSVEVPSHPRTPESAPVVTNTSTSTADKDLDDIPF